MTDITILLIEDNPGDARIIAELLKEGSGFVPYFDLRYELLTASTLAGGMDILATSNVDLVLLDLGLPDSQGLETVQHILTTFNNIPVIVLTIQSNEEMGIDAIKIGAQDYLFKGQVEPFQIVRSIRFALERNQLANKLNESELKFKDLVDHMINGVSVFQAFDEGTDFILTDINSAGEKIERMDREDLLGKKLTELFPDTKKSGVLEAFQQVWKTGIPKYSSRNIYRDEQFSIAWRESWVYRMPNNDIVAVYNDISERKRSERALRAMNEKLNLLSSITRHDILNKITTLMLYQDLLEEIVDEEVHTNYLEPMISATQEIERQIMFTRDYQDLGIKSPIWQEVEPVAQNAVNSVLNQNIKADVNMGNLQIFADSMFNKVFYNLLENALRHGEKVTEISISFLENDNNGVIVVEDDGVGVADDMKEKIFSHGVGMNTGFGLFLAKEILDITGISIRECGTFGRGARFEIAIPYDGYRI